VYFIGHVDEDHWLKLDSISFAYKIVLVALFHLGGQILFSGLVLSLPKKNG
jgi:hypothetical protein